MRNRLAAGAVIAIVAVGVGGCAAGGAPPGPSPTPTSRDVSVAYRCLADHSPWTLDLDAAHAEWSDAADDPAHPVTGGEANGTATVRFSRGETPRWEFTATGVDYELFFADGVREATEVAADSHGRYAIAEPGDRLVLSAVQVDASSETATTTASDGTTASGVTVAAPLFPWLVGSSVAFTCTEHRLVISTPGQVPASWTLQPGG